MTVDEVVKGLVGLALAALSAVTGWLVKTAQNNREEIIMLKGKVENLEEEKMTPECVREAIKEALDERDEVAEERRKEWDRHQLEKEKRFALEVEKAVNDGIEKALPKILREVRSAATGRIQPHHGSDQGQVV